MGDLTAISLFTCGGIGDLAVRAAGFDILVSNELDAQRHAVFLHNFPECDSITGDIWLSVDEIVQRTHQRLGGRELDAVFATPPCQGMSKNGRGKLLNAIRAGLKPPMDVRNRLIIPTMTVIKALRPRIVVFENVPEMADTLLVDEAGLVLPIVDFIRRELGPEYDGKAEVVEFADYGVPQCRQRLITIFSRHDDLRRWLKENGTLLPLPTHASRPSSGRRIWRTVRDAIADFPPLDARELETATSRDVPFHSVPVLDAMKYWWVQHTPAERTAFDNQCVECGFGSNLVHSARRDVHGVNRTTGEAPVHCIACGKLLPRPSVEFEGRRRLMKGFTSAYKRMSYDKPASALTRNLSYACSDNKLHPEQNRVLSLAEAFRLHTVDEFAYEWCSAPDGQRVSDKVIRELIGESIPPAGFRVILEHLRNVYLGMARSTWLEREAPLFASVSAEG
jgi:DNA (cytosine-5)-methyltransferase 1